MNTNPLAYEEVPQSEAPQAEAKAPKKKNVASRLFALLLAVAGVAVVFLLNVNVVVGNGLKELTLFTAVKDAFASTNTTKMFGVPALANAGRLAGIGANISFYLVLVCLVLSVVFALVAVFSAKKAPALLRLVAFFFTLGFAQYALVIYMYSTVALGKATLDLFTLAPAGVGAFVYFVLGVAKIGKKAWMNVFQLILTLASVGALAYALVTYTSDFNNGVSKLVSFRIATLAILGVAFLSVLIGAIRLQTKKGLCIDMFRYVLQFVVAGATCYVAFASKASDKMFLILAIVSAVVALLQIILCSIQKKSGKPKKEKKAKKAKKEKKAKAVEENKEVETPVAEEEFTFTPAYDVPAPIPAPVYEAPAPAPVVTPAVCAPVTEPSFEEKYPEYTVEEYAEAMPYNGGPVEGVAVAEEVNPTFVAPPAQVQTAGYDFYNCKSFDPFIASLNEAERNQFTEIFILKYKGTMPEIPEYEVGGDNKGFFRKLFIYLGQYRDRIPDSLLAKIYQFTIRM